MMSIYTIVRKRRKKMPKVYKVYIFGALNDDAVGYIVNLHKMIKFAIELRKEGFSVYVPGIDFLLGVVAGNWTYRDYFDNSQPWLRASDALCAVPDNWKSSTGSEREQKSADVHNIPVFYEKKDLIKWRDEKERVEK